MSRLPDPDIAAVTGAFLSAEADFVVVGGFAVIANRYVRATEDVDLLIPSDPDNDRRCLGALASLDAKRLRDDAELTEAMLIDQAHLRVLSSAGLIDLIREGAAPLDFASAQGAALKADMGLGEFSIAGLRTVVAMKRLAGRPRDRNDLAELEAEHGELPIDPVPGLDS